ncbi:MAG: hypothetical protein MUF41_03290, partial [Sphingopyxis sp.]|nr:hypothetical protein [Sphingopyxis sp.]
RELGIDHVVAGVPFFAWCIRDLAPLHEDAFEGPFLGFALLALTLEASWEPSDSVIELCRWIDREVTAALREFQWQRTRGKNWILSMNIHNLRNSRWVELGHEFKRWAADQQPGELATWLGLIGCALAEE